MVGKNRFISVLSSHPCCFHRTLTLRKRPGHSTRARCYVRWWHQMKSFSFSPVPKAVFRRAAFWFWGSWTDKKGNRGTSLAQRSLQDMPVVACSPERFRCTALSRFLTHGVVRNVSHRRDPSPQGGGPSLGLHVARGLVELRLLVHGTAKSFRDMSCTPSCQRGTKHFFPITK